MPMGLIIGSKVDFSQLNFFFIIHWMDGWMDEWQENTNTFLSPSFHSFSIHSRNLRRAGE